MMTLGNHFQFLLGLLLCVSWSQNGIFPVSGLPPPWKLMMVPMVPPPAAGSVPTDVATGAGAASAPAPALTAPFLPFAYPGYPGLWSPYFGVPPLPFLLASSFGPSSNETDAALLTFLVAKAEEKKEKDKAKAAKKTAKDTAAAIQSGTTLPEISQLAALLKNMLQMTTVASASDEQSEDDLIY